MLVFLKEIIKKIFNKSTKEYTVAELLTMSNYRNGYIREEAVYELGLRGDAIAIPALFTRVNDWVYEVRVASKKSLIQLLTQDNVEAFVRELPKLYKLERYTRENHTQFIEQIIDYLISGKHQQYIVQAFDSEDIYLARIAQKLCIPHSRTIIPMRNTNPTK